MMTLLITPAGSMVFAMDLNVLPDADLIRSAVGGPIETVPYFDTVEIAGHVYQCIAFCDEEGKLAGKPLNSPATILWRKSLNDAGMIINDYLVGDIFIVMGTSEELELL